MGLSIQSSATGSSTGEDTERRAERGWDEERDTELARQQLTQKDLYSDRRKVPPFGWASSVTEPRPNLALSSSDVDDT